MKYLLAIYSYALCLLINFCFRDGRRATEFKVLKAAPVLSGIITSTKSDFGFLLELSEEDVAAGPKPVRIASKMPRRNTGYVYIRLYTFIYVCIRLYLPQI